MDERMRQLKTLDTIADVISYYDSTESTAKELVKFYESEGLMPDWYNDHDRGLLITKVENIING